VIAGEDQPPIPASPVLRVPPVGHEEADDVVDVFRTDSLGATAEPSNRRRLRLWLVQGERQDSSAEAWIVRQRSQQGPRK